MWIKLQVAGLKRAAYEGCADKVIYDKITLYFVGLRMFY